MGKIAVILTMTPALDQHVGYVRTRRCEQKKGELHDD